MELERTSVACAGCQRSGCAPGAVKQSPIQDSLQEDPQVLVVDSVLEVNVDVEFVEVLRQWFLNLDGEEQAWSAQMLSDGMPDEEPPPEEVMEESDISAMLCRVFKQSSHEEKSLWIKALPADCVDQLPSEIRDHEEIVVDDEFGAFLKDWYDLSGTKVVDESVWRKPLGFKGWGRCPGEEHLKTDAERQSDRSQAEQEMLQPMRAFCRAYIRKHGVRPKAADCFTAAGGQALGLFMAGFDVVGFEIDEAHRANFMERDEMEYIPGIGDVRHTLSFVCSDFFKTDLSEFQVVTASPPCSPFSSLPALSDGRAPSQVPKMIDATREVLRKLGVIYAIENVSGASHEMQGNVVGVCGTMFGLPVYRHRLYESSFETPWLKDSAQAESAGTCSNGLGCKHKCCCMGARALMPRVKKVTHMDGSVTLERVPPCCKGCMFGVFGSLKSWGGSLEEWRSAMGLPHLNARQLALAIPPHYSRYMGGMLAMELCKSQGVEWSDIQYELSLLSRDKRDKQKNDGVAREDAGSSLRPMVEVIDEALPGMDCDMNVEFLQWVMSLAKVPSCSMTKLHVWYR